MMTNETPQDGKSVFDKLLDVISDVSMFISGVLLVVLTAIFGWLVYGRYVLNATPTWVEQAALLLVVYISFLGASVGIHKNTHLGVSVFCELCPSSIQKVFAFLSHILLCGFGVVMVIYGFKLTLFKWDTDISLVHVSEGVRTIPIFLSGFLIVLYSINHLIHLFKNSCQKTAK